MYRNVLLPQLKRAPWRTALFLVLLAIATAFFCLSANLYRNSNRNIQMSGDAYSTVAHLEFIGKSKAVKEAAEKYGMSIFEPNAALDVTDFSVQQLETLPGVEKIDLRRYLAAYIPGHFAYTPPDISFTTILKPGHARDLIRFKIIGSKPVVVNAKVESTGNTDLFFEEDPIGVQIEWSATGAYEYAEWYILVNWIENVDNGGTRISECYPLQQAQKQAFNNGIALAEDEIILMPGVEYLASVEMNGYFSKTSTGKYYLVSQYHKSGIHADGKLHFTFDSYGLDLKQYLKTKRYILPGPSEVAAEDQPIGIWRWEDVQNDPELLAYFERVEQAYQYSSHSFYVTTTEDLFGVPRFYTQSAFISQGRPFTETEYQNGDRVCIVSADVAETQGWKVGDTIPMHFYSSDFCADTNRRNDLFPTYTKRNDGFFDQGEYTIVGIWDQLDINSGSSLKNTTEHLPWNEIYVPSSSVQNLDTVDAPVSGSRLTVHLENGMMKEFLEAASKITLSESADEVRITAFDQGYSQAQDSLQSMLGTAQFLLVLSSVLLVVAGVLLAFFYTQSQKQNMALMRLLGCSRRQAGTMAMLGSLLILLPGGILGTAAGHLLTDRVASAILNGTNTLDKPEYAGFREIFGVQAEVEFALAAQPAVSALALAVAAGLFLLGCIGFTLLHLRKEPREALQDQ